MISFLAKSEGGKLSFETEYNKARFRGWLRENDGKRVRISPVSSKVSEEARGYYFGAVIPFLKKLVSAWEGNSGDQIHEILKKEFNGFEAFNPKSGKVEKFGQSIAVEDSQKFQEYLLRLADWVMENYSQRLPDPEEFKRNRDSAMLINEI